MRITDKKNKAGDYVVLLHGLGRTHHAMNRMHKYLTLQGYEVYNNGYPSTIYAIDQLAKNLWFDIQMHCQDKQRKIHFVGHSLGAILIRFIIAEYSPQNLGRVVMLGPPNRGSYLVDRLKNYRFYKNLFGPAGQQLGTDIMAILHVLPDVNYEAGIIAGDRSIDKWFSWFVLTGQNDGKIMVDETKLTGIDHIVLHATHTFMAQNKKVIYQTHHFLQKGRFLRGK